MPLSDLQPTLRIQPTVARRTEDFVAIGQLTNSSEAPLELELAPLSSPSLALQLRTQRGEAVPMPPPPVPSGDRPHQQLAPGDAYEVRFAGFLPSWTGPGSYEARLRYVTGEGELYSDWVPFELTTRA